MKAAGDLLRLSLGVVFHPLDTFGYIKRNRGYFSYLPVAALLLVVVAVRIATIYLTHFPLSGGVSPENANFFREFAKYTLPVIGWSIACFIMTSIMDGECLFKELLTASCYAMIPFILFMIPIAIVSNVMSLYELDIYYFLVTGIWGWVILLYFISVKVLNDYTVLKTLVVCIVSALALFVIVAVLLLVYSMINQFFQIVYDIYTEARMLYW